MKTDDKNNDGKVDENARASDSRDSTDAQREGARAGVKPADTGVPADQGQGRGK